MSGLDSEYDEDDNDDGQESDESGNIDDASALSFVIARSCIDEIKISLKRCLLISGEYRQSEDVHRFAVVNISLHLIDHVIMQCKSFQNTDVPS